LGVIFFISIAIGLGVWRRRVYIARRTTVYTAAPSSHLVTQYATYWKSSTTYLALQNR
jgi:hypothetical protein